MVVLKINKEKKHQGESELMKAHAIRYANGLTSAERFSEIKALIENTETSDPALLHAMERLVYAEIDSKQFIRMKDNIYNNKNGGLETNKLKLRYAQGDLGEDRFLQLCGK